MKSLLVQVLIGVLMLLGSFFPVDASVIDSDGEPRSFEMYVPPTTPRPLPMVLILHGGRGTATQIRTYTHFDTIASREGILAVYPQAVQGLWNDGRPELEAISHRVTQTNDVKFLLTLIDHLIERGLADPHRVYVAGLADGGLMALRLACEHPDRLTAAAMVAANQPVSMTCAAQRPVPFVFFHGTADRFMPMDGGDILQWDHVNRGKILSADETVGQWLRINGCSGEPHEQQLSGTHNSLDVDQITYDDCSGAPVEHFITQEGGHGWPGAEQSRVGDQLLGPVGHTIDAGEEIWKFFKQFH